MLCCFVGAANQADVKAAPTVLVPALESYPRIEKVLADQAYKGLLGLALWTAYGCNLELTERLGEGFVVEPWRWIVERTFALARQRSSCYVRITNSCPSIMRALSTSR